MFIASPPVVICSAKNGGFQGHAWGLISLSRDLSSQNGRRGLPVRPSAFKTPKLVFFSKVVLLQLVNAFQQNDLEQQHESSSDNFVVKTPLQVRSSGISVDWHFLFWTTIFTIYLPPELHKGQWTSSSKVLVARPHTDYATPKRSWRNT
jgi:hypothetical protein